MKWRIKLEGSLDGQDPFEVEGVYIRTEHSYTKIDVDFLMIEKEVAKTT